MHIYFLNPIQLNINLIFTANLLLNNFEFIQLFPSLGEVLSCMIKFLPPVTLHITLSHDYPTSSPPSLKLSCLWLTQHQVSLFFKCFWKIINPLMTNKVFNYIIEDETTRCRTSFSLALTGRLSNSLRVVRVPAQRTCAIPQSLKWHPPRDQWVFRAKRRLRIPSSALSNRQYRIL